MHELSKPGEAVLEHPLSLSKCFELEVGNRKGRAASRREKKCNPGINALSRGERTLLFDPKGSSYEFTHHSSESTQLAVITNSRILQITQARTAFGTKG